MPKTNRLQKRLLALVLAAAMGMGCGPTESSPDVSVGVSDTLDGTVNVEEDTSASPDLGTTPSEDTGTSLLECPGEAGCKCLGHGQCDSGLCIDTPIGKRCAADCIDTCPGGFTCTTVIGGADQQSYCVPSHGTSCRPCTKHDHCGFAAPKPMWCVSYGRTVGSFCAMQCSSDNQCAKGYACRLSDKIGGGKAKSCVLVASKDSKLLGVCPCSTVAVDEALTTTCAVEKKKDGVVVTRCKGERNCAGGKLSECEQFVGENASCVDVQCVGQKDGAKCDDGDKCTTGDNCQAGVCSSTANLCDCKVTSDCFGKQKDLDKQHGKCAPRLFCDLNKHPHICTPNPKTIVTCSDSGDTPCKKNRCHPDTGKCTYIPEKTTVACDDGDVCSSGDSCDGKGLCSAGKTNLCECKKAADCVAKDDGNACNGVMYCDKSAKKNYTCKINPATVVKCTPSKTACITVACETKTGNCVPKPVADLKTCEDGDKCTTGDHCKAGKCTKGTNTCKCKGDFDCAKHEDGNACNGKLFCNKVTGQCLHNPATVINCPSVDDTACVKNTCQPKTGKCKAELVNEFGKCYDGNPCTVGDGCTKGVCKGGTNLCECKSDNDCALKDDGDLCNGILYCDKAKQPWTCELNHATKIKCQSVDDTVCASNVCQKKTGKCVMTARNDGLGCDADNTPCTPDDKCVNGTCTASQNNCGCKVDADCAAKEDGNPCNGTLVCDKKPGEAGACVVDPNTIVVCPSSSAAPCVLNVCDVKTGKCANVHAPANTLCDDGNPATKSDTCENGTCVPGTDISVCKQDSDCAQFGDGDKCKSTLLCQQGKCVKKTKDAIVCTTKAPCTVAYCDPKTGKCTASPGDEGKKCDDNLKCTTGDSCKKGSCTGIEVEDGAAVCDDQNPCTIDSCPGVAACENKKRSDGESCAADKICNAGQCVAKQTGPCGDGTIDSSAGEQCDPGVPAQKDSCSASCKWKPCAEWAVINFAGTGAAGFQGGGALTNAQFNYPWDVAVTQSGRVFVVDRAANSLRRIDIGGTVSTVYPVGKMASLMKGPSTVLWVPATKSVYVGELFTSTIRKFDLHGGNGLVVTDGTGPDPVKAARGMALFNNSGDLYVADSGKHRIVRLTSKGVIKEPIGSGPGFGGDKGHFLDKSVLFKGPGNVSNYNFELWIADAGNNRIRIAANTLMNTLAGTGTAGHVDDANGGVKVQFNRPEDIVHTITGSAMVVDVENSAIRLVHRSGATETAAGAQPTTGAAQRHGDATGSGKNARFKKPRGITADGLWGFYIADTDNHRIKRMVCKKW